MTISVTDTDEVITEHIPDRLEANLLKSGGNVEEIELIVYFKVKTILPNGKVVGEPYLDTNNPLRLNCKGNAELTQSVITIQQAIGLGRYQQMTAPSLETLETPETLPS